MSHRLSRRNPSFRQSQYRASVVITDDDVYSYALRAAYLHYLLTPRPRQKAPPAPAPIQRQSTATSIHDLMREFQHVTTSKSSKLPKDMLPMLRTKMEQVWMGHYTHAEFKDALVKRTFATFYAQFTERSFYKNIKETRRPEDLVLIFYSSATKEIQKAKPGDDAWKMLVDRHVALFVRLLQHCLKDGGWQNSNSELYNRMHTLETKLLRNEQNLTDERSNSSSQTNQLQPFVPLSYNVNDMPMVKIVARVFNVQLAKCQSDIDQNRSIWTEQAALQELKAYTTYKTRKTLKVEDFAGIEAFEAWKKAETPEVSKMILHVIQSNPTELSKSTSSPIAGPGSRASVAYSPSSPYRTSVGPDGFTYSTDPADMDIYGGLHAEEIEFNYIYMPPDPRQYYRTVLLKCLQSDLNDPDMPPPDTSGEAPVKLMSKSSTDLLAELSTRWRVTLASRMAFVVDCARELYRDQTIGLVFLDAAFMFFKENTDPEWQSWLLADQMMHTQALGKLHDDLLRELYEMLLHAYDPKATPIGRVMYILDNHVLSDPLFSPQPLEPFVNQLRAGLEEKAQDAYNTLLEEIPENLAEMDALHVHDTVDNLIKLTEKIQKRFKEPIMGKVNPTLILVETVYPKFAEDSAVMVGEVMKAFKARDEEVPIEDGFAVYGKLCEIRRIYTDVFPKKPYPVNVEEMMQDFVWRWLKITDSKVIGWVDAAYQQDNFMLTAREEHGREPTDDERHTSSVVDIFRSFNQMVNDLQKIEWQDEYQLAKFTTALAKTLGLGLGRYCEVLEKVFTFEMDRQSPEQVTTQARQRQWLSGVMEAWSNKEKIEPFQFAPESCIKLNNVEFAVQQLDKLEGVMGVEQAASIIARYEPPLDQRRQASYVFTIKIVEGEDLKAMDIGGASDPYVVVGDEYQKRLHKTRVIYANLNPRWDETFEITVQSPVYLTFTIWDWDTLGDHDCVGRASIKLDPAHFSDYLPKEFWQKLDTQGRLLVRVSMEGERDDIEFYFARAFRTLMRTQRDMTRQITDKLSAFIHHCLSRDALKALLSRGISMSSVTSLFSRTGLTGARPASVANHVSDLEIAQALEPLTDYFNENFAILNQTLTSSAMIMVMTKLWKEVLVTLESLLVPTLSDKPSQQRQLTQQEVDVVFKWLNIMYDFFYAKDETTGEGTGVPADVLRSIKFHELQTLNFFYFDSTDNLIRESERMANTAAAHQQAERNRLTGSTGGFLGVPGAKRSKSILHSRNLGTMRKIKAEKRREAQAVPSDDMILRILRMRPEATGYLKDRSRQKDRLASTAAAEAIVRQSMQAGGGRMSAMGVQGLRR